MPLKDDATVNDAMGTGVAMKSHADSELAASQFVFAVECRDKDGALKWTDTAHNTVMIAAKNDMESKYFLGVAYTAAWFVGLLGGTGTIANTDTLASHPGWTEISGYAGNRPSATFGSPSGGIVSESASFSINANATILGAFLASSNSGSSGVLYDAALFSGGSRAVQTGDTLTVTATLQIS